MTVKRAIALLNFLIEFENKMQKNMADPSHPWNYSFDCVKELANTLAKSHKDNVRILNIIKKELGLQGAASRYGGEEFAILLPKAKLGDGIELAEKIRKVISLSRSCASSS